MHRRSFTLVLLVSMLLVLACRAHIALFPDQVLAGSDVRVALVANAPAPGRFVVSLLDAADDSLIASATLQNPNVLVQDR